MRTQVARMGHHRAVRTLAYPIDVLLQELSTGQTTVIDSDAAELAGGRTLRHATEYARRLLSEGKKDAYDEVKKSLPAFSPAGFSSDGTREIDTLTGLVCLEWDDLQDPAWAFSMLAQSPLTFAAWYSLSGGGPKALFKVEPVPTPETFAEAWYAAAVEFEDIGDSDLKASRHSQPQGLVWCPDLYHNPNARPIEFDPEAYDFQDAYPSVHTDADLAALSDLPSEYQALLVDLDFDENGQCKTRVPCPSENHENDSFENLRANATTISKLPDGGLRFHCFKCGKTRIFSKDGRLPRGLTVDSSFQRETSDLESERQSVATGLENWLTRTEGETGQILNITTAAGTGKTTVSISTAENLLYIAKTTEEADQAFSVSSEMEKDAWRHHPRRFNRDSEDWDTLPVGLGTHQRPCIQPELCNAIASAGHSPQVICDRCPVLSECTESGYLSQEQIERNSQQVFYSWDEAFFSDVVYRDRVKRLCDGAKLLVCDEAVPSRLPMERKLSISELAALADRWLFPEQMELYQFLSHLTGELAKAVSPSDFQKAILLVNELTEDTVIAWDALLGTLPIACVLEGDGIASVEWDIKNKQVDALLVFDSKTPVEKFRIYWKYVSLFKLQELGFFDPHNIPRVYPQFFSDLKLFLHSLSRSSTPPCHRNKDDWYYYLPPGLNADRGVVLSASDTADHISEVYRGTGIDVTTLTGKPPKWKAGCQLFQISTGRYTLRQGLLKSGSTLKKQAARMVVLIRLTAETGKKCLVVAQNDFINSEGLQPLREHRNVTLINHHHAEGRNDYQDHDIVFVFHFEPAPEVIQSQASRIFRTASDLSFERGHTEIKKDGVSLKRERYRDNRVQQVFDRECEARLMQSVLRLRQHLNENKIAVLFTAEPVSGLPLAPVPFKLAEAERHLREGRNWDTLGEDTEQNTDVQLVMEKEGVSRRTAERRSRPAREQRDAERDASICHRYTELEQTQQEIADALGIGLATVNRVLKKFRLRQSAI